MRARVQLAALASLAALLSAPPAMAAPRTHVVEMAKMKFGAMPAGVRIGDTIVWVNKDIVRHTATAQDGSFNADLMPGARGRTLIRKAGVIRVLCKFHPGMRATLRVAAK